MCNSTNPIWASQISPSTLNYSMTANQLLMSSTLSNNWVSMSGDGTINSTGVLTIGTGTITNTKLLNSSISINGLSMSLGAIYTLPLLSITNGMLTGSIDNTKLLNSSITINGSSMSLGGTYTLPTTIPLLSITNGMLAGSIDNTKLLNSSITLGTTAMSLGSTYSTIAGPLTLTDLLTCDGGLSLTTSHASSGTSSLSTTFLTNTTYMNGYTTSFEGGNVTSHDGVLLLRSASVGTNHIHYGTLIQNNSNNTYIDNIASAVGLGMTPSINIGTIIPDQVINLGNSTTNLKWDGGNFLRHTTVKFNNFNIIQFSAVSTIWYPIRSSGAGNLVLTYTGRQDETIEITVRISGSGTGSGNLYNYFDIHYGTQPAYSVSSTNPSAVTLTTPTVNSWGSWLFGGVSNQYQGVNFTITYTFTTASTKTFYPVFRVQTTNSTWAFGSSTAGINCLGEMTIKTLF